jgi:hypothetical protein
VVRVSSIFHNAPGNGDGTDSCFCSWTV